ncbi:MAG: glutamate--cysteine ligase [Candidatus Gastranaerophilales bacterium]|nr:glutamate--cysteine ligase [Candidatus Gastranaerophilales bacterium]
MERATEQTRIERLYIANKSSLSAYFFDSFKGKSDFKIGVEFEKLGINEKTLKAIGYFERGGTADILCNLINRYDYNDITENSYLLGLIGADGTVTIEPGNQFEFSTTPEKLLKKLEEKFRIFNRQTSLLAEEYGVIWIGAGIQPLSTYQSIEMIPKERYAIMRDYLPQKGAKSPVMMMETASIQTSIDFESEEDAMRKLRLSLLISPFVTAMFANSPIREGKLSGYKSFRALSWLDTDNDRCGLISEKILEKGFGFDDYVDVLLNVPMFFIKRGGKLIHTKGMTFNEFIKKGFNGHKATLDDWYLHMTTFFPDVRLKGCLEIRTCDFQRNSLFMAFPALAKGIMYNNDALLAVEELLNDISWNDLCELRNAVPLNALQAEVNGHKVSDIALELINIAETSLKSEEQDESGYLQNIKELVQDDKSPADVVIESWNSSWKGDIRKFIEYSRLE